MLRKARMSAADELYVDRLRGVSILRVVLVHLGLSWVFSPWSEFVHAFMPILFFVSGAVSYFSFKRAQSVGSFLTRRSLALTLPYYVIALAAFSVLWATTASPPEVDIGVLLSWLSLSPSAETMPYRLGQVWFLHSLMLIMIAAIPVFILSLRKNWIWYPALAVSLVVATGQLFLPVDDLLVLAGHDLYQPIANAGFFFFGAFFYERRELFGRWTLMALLAVSAAVAAAHPLLLDVAIGLAAHSHAPDLYYVSASFAAICLALLVQAPVSDLLDKARVLDRFILFYSKHAFSVFLLHSYFIEAAENYLGLVDVAGEPLRAAVKIAFVLAATSLASVPLSAFCTMLRQEIEQRLVPAPATPQAGVATRG